MKTLTAIIFLTIIAFIPLIGYAVGVSVSPATLRMETRVGKETIARFTVWNPSKEVGLFSAYPEEFEEFITLIPSSFVLESGEKREVLVTGKRREAGIVRTAIAIEGRMLGAPALGVGGGVRLPLSLEVNETRNALTAAVASAAAPTLFVLTLLILLSAVLLYTLKRAARQSTL